MNGKVTQQAGARRTWSTPVLKTITAGSAEKQVNDVTPDGQGNQKS